MTLFSYYKAPANLHILSLSPQFFPFALFKEHVMFHHFHTSFNEISRPHGERDIFFKRNALHIQQHFIPFSIANNLFTPYWCLVTFIFYYVVLKITLYSIFLSHPEIFLIV